MDTIEDTYQFRALFQAMTEAVVVLNNNDVVIRFNEAALKILGVNPSELLNLNIYTTNFNPVREDLTSINKDSTPLQQVRRTGIAQINQIIGINRGKELRWLSVNAVPIFFERSKTPEQILITFKDISEEKLGREKLFHLQHQIAQREKFLDTTLNALPVLVSYVDRNLNYQYVNSTYEKWFKVGRHDVLGKSIKKILGHEAFKLLEPYVEGVLRGESQTFTSKVPYLEAGERTVEVYYIPDLTPEGVRGFYAIINDITELVNIGEKIKKQEEELSRILDAIPALIGHWDKNLINIHTNKAYSEYFGKRPEEIKGKHIRELLGPELYEKNFPFIQKVLEGVVQTFERDLQLPDGKIKHTLATYLPEIVDNQVIGIFVVVTDVSPIKDLLQKELESREKAERATKLRDDMVAVVSHDLRNPLSVILSSAEMLSRKNQVIDAGKKSIDRIIKSSKIMITMLNDLLDIDKIEQGHFEIQDGACLQDPLSYLQEIVELQRPIAKEKNIQMFLEVVPDLPMITFNANQLNRVFQNLIGNAIKFSHEEGSIWVRAKKCDEGILFQIEDNGIDIDADLLPIIFDRYSQGKKFSNKGSGLGLAIAKGIVEAHKGKIWVESQVGKGSIFHFLLPSSLKEFTSPGTLVDQVQLH